MRESSAYPLPPNTHTHTHTKHTHPTTTKEQKQKNKKKTNQNSHKCEMSNIPHFAQSLSFKIELVILLIPESALSLGNQAQCSNHENFHIAQNIVTMFMFFFLTGHTLSLQVRLSKK